MTSFDALSCPQCGGPLPRQARWRMVACPFCGAEVTRREAYVRTAPFHEAWLRSKAFDGNAGPVVRCADNAYRVLGRLGAGERSEVFLGERCGPLRERVVVKLALQAPAGDAFEAEGLLLQRLQAIAVPKAAYFSQRLPQVVAWGAARDWRGRDTQALLLRHPPGYWGSLADVIAANADGVDARHAVWMWRRVLEMLGFLHGADFTHGDVQPAHLLVQPRDHGVMLIGWARAATNAGTPVRDLQQSAWAVRELLAGVAHDAPPQVPASTPAPLAELVRQTSEDASWCEAQGAAGIDRKLVEAAAQSFGPPRFVAFDPDRAGTVSA